MNDWTKVEDALPNVLESVLVVRDKYTIDIQYINSSGEWVSGEVTHWMRLPTPPPLTKKEQKNTVVVQKPDLEWNNKGESK